MDKITSENLFSVDIQKLALDPRFGSLIFSNAGKKLHNAKGWVEEAYDLKFRDLLLQSDINLVEKYARWLVDNLEWIRNFDISAVSNPKSEHDSFESRVDGFYNEVYQHLLMRILPFLREERRRENPDQKQFDDEVKKVVKLRTEMENEFNNIKQETQKLREMDKQVGAAKGERAAVRMAVHFDSEVSKYTNLSNRWFIATVIAYILVVVTSIIVGLRALQYIEKTSMDAPHLWSFGVTRLVIIAMLWYGVSFILKNFNVNSHLVAINRHRAAVARTLEDFMAVEQQNETPRLSEMLQNATFAMFKHAAIGYVSKTEKESGSPLYQIVNDLMGK